MYNNNKLGPTGANNSITRQQLLKGVNKKYYTTANSSINNKNLPPFP